MTSIVFYLLADQAPAARDHYACVLAEQAMREQRAVLILTRDDEHSEQIDSLLWSFRDDSFVPHRRLDGAHGQKPDAAVHISRADTLDPRCASKPVLLVNLSDRVPRHFQHFQLLAEIICATEPSKQIARQRYRFYRKQGHAPQHHPLRRRVLSDN